MLIPIDRSGPHIHLCEHDAETLGVLTAHPAKALRCAGNYVSDRRAIGYLYMHYLGSVPVLLPWRAYSQIELPVSTFVKAGVAPFITTSGKRLQDAPTASIMYRDPDSDPIYMDSWRTLKIHAIAVRQHIHAGPNDGLTDRGVYQVRISSPRGVVYLMHVKCYVTDGAVPVLHVDNDEYAAYVIDKSATAEITGGGSPDL